MFDQDFTDDVEQLEKYYQQLLKFIEHHRGEFIMLLEEKKRIELILETYGKIRLL